MANVNVLFFPKIGKITRDVTVVHFFLMFGYKLFSLFFPLFLITREMTFSQVGWTYLLIYLPIALFSPIVGFLNHKINPALLAFVGILGYATYGLGMLFVAPEQGGQMLYIFYFLQVLLGISASLFFASFKGILMGSYLKKPTGSFGWFYSAPFYASATAPVVGAFLIWQFGFSAVFIASTIIHAINSVLCLIWLYRPAEKLVDIGFTIGDFFQSIKSSLKIIFKKDVFPIISLSVIIIILTGFHGSFFVIFLKEVLFWEDNIVLIFVSFFSLVFTPLSLFIIKRLSRKKPQKILLEGSIMAGLFTALIGALTPFLNFLNLIFLDLGRTVGWLSVNSVRSGVICKKLRKYPEEGGFIDTIFQPLGVAIGSFSGGILIEIVGFSNVFILIGLFVCLATLIFWLVNQRLKTC